MTRNSDDIDSSGATSMHHQRREQSTIRWVKDDQYYIDSGDCVIRVENVHFKVRIVGSNSSMPPCNLPSSTRNKLNNVSPNDVRCIL